MILCHVLGKDRTWLLAHPTDPVDPTDFERAGVLLARRIRREPLPHLLGEWEFMGHSYEVGPAALIPRPETEVLVESVTERLRWQLPFEGRTVTGKGEFIDADSCNSVNSASRGREAGGEARVPQQVLEVGTGTGCIAIELSLRLPEAAITSVDVSTTALELALRNVARFGLEDRVSLRQARFPDEAQNLGLFDAIVSNPPYIPSDEVERLAPELVLYEPRSALDGGPDGLEVIRSLATESRRLLKPGGLLAMEIGHDQAESVIALLGAAAWEDVEVIPDLAGIQRVVLARAPG